MNINKLSILTKSAASIGVISFLAGSASAVLVYPDSTATNGGEFNSNFVMANPTNGGHTAPSDTEDADLSGAGLAYATANPPANAIAGSRAVLTMEFATTVDLSEIYIWNHSFNAAAGAPANGVRDFTLSFYDGAGGSGTQIGSTYTGLAAASPQTGDYAAQELAFGTTYSDVRSVVMNIVSDQGNDSDGFVAIRDLAFNAVPEPSSAALLAFGGLALLSKRRR